MNPTGYHTSGRPVNSTQTIQSARNIFALKALHSTSSWYLFSNAPLRTVLDPQMSKAWLILKCLPCSWTHQTPLSSDPAVVIRPWPVFRWHTLMDLLSWTRSQGLLNCLWDFLDGSAPLQSSDAKSTQVHRKMPGLQSSQHSWLLLILG